MSNNKGQVPWNKGLKGYKNPKRRTGKIVQCEYCHKDIYKQNHSIKSNKKFFCSQDCCFASKKGLPLKNVFNRGRKPWNYIDGRSKGITTARYGDDWDNIRHLIYSRDSYTCQDCKKREIKLDVHHIVPFLVTFDNSLGNLISLCRSCHMKREHQLIKQQQDK